VGYRVQVGRSAKVYETLFGNELRAQLGSNTTEVAVNTHARSEQWTRESASKLKQKPKTHKAIIYAIILCTIITQTQ